MALIPQLNLFSWEEIESKSDLDRLRLVLDTIPDEALIQKMEKARGRGRNDYPIRPLWNSILAGIVYEHLSLSSLRRELQRNGELRKICGFNLLYGAASVPTPRAYTTFFKNLYKYEKDIEEMFDTLVVELKGKLPDLGTDLAIDSKAIQSIGKPNRGNPDGRRETDADWGKKDYKGLHEDGNPWEKVKSWFGYKLHIIVDSNYELPVAWDLTRASTSDTTNLLPMMKKLKEKHPQIVQQAKHLSADRGYDSTQNNQKLYQDYKIKPIIDTRQMWKDREKTRALYANKADCIVYDERGGLYCIAESKFDAKQTVKTSLAFDGFEPDRNTLKYRCPAAAYGYECSQRQHCSNSDYGRVVRVDLGTDGRIFTPISRDSYKWKRLYKKRTAVERVNSRLDVSFGFERHYIRGRKKMKVRTGLALVVMLSMALGRIRTGQKEKMRSLFAPTELQKAA